MSINKILELLKDIWPEGSKCGHGNAAKAIAMLEALSDQFTWVPVENRLPPINKDGVSETVFIWSPRYEPGFVGQAFYWEYYDEFRDGSRLYERQWCDWESMAPMPKHSEPTHWMPGPVPPGGH